MRRPWLSLYRDVHVNGMVITRGPEDLTAAVCIWDGGSQWRLHATSLTLSVPLLPSQTVRQLRPMQTSRRSQSPVDGCRSAELLQAAQPGAATCVRRPGGPPLDGLRAGAAAARHPGFRDGDAVTVTLPLSGSDSWQSLLQSQTADLSDSWSEDYWAALILEILTGRTEKQD